MQRASAGADRESAILDWLAQQRGAMTALLERLVNIDSGSYDKAGVDAVGAALREFLEREGVACESSNNDTFGGALKARVPFEGPSGNAGGPIVLMGHRDTVFPDGEATRRPFRIEGDIAYGPGVADMKAGLVMHAFILAAFRRFGGEPGPLMGLFTADEEIGSPSSRTIIEETARHARVVYNAEPGRVSGNVVTGRKGGVFMAFEITGKSAHSGVNFTDGISAIEELARKTQALHALTDLAKGITVNVGLVSGGQSVNTVAPWARGEIDLRYVAPADREAALAAIAGVIATRYVPGTQASLQIKGEFLPLTQSAWSKRVFEHYVACAGDVGFSVGGEFTGGCADSGFVAAVGAPVLCAVGPVGGKAHSPEEFLRIDTMVPRAQAVALSILRLDKMA